MQYYSTKERKYTVSDQYGVINNSEAKSIEELDRHELEALAYAMQNKIDRMYERLDAVISTMNKFLAHDHPDVLQNLLQHQDETDRRY